MFCWSGVLYVIINSGCFCIFVLYLRRPVYYNQFMLFLRICFVGPASCMLSSIHVVFAYMFCRSGVLYLIVISSCCFCEHVLWVRRPVYYCHQFMLFLHICFVGLVSCILSWIHVVFAYMFCRSGVLYIIIINSCCFCIYVLLVRRPVCYHQFMLFLHICFVGPASCILSSSVHVVFAYMFCKSGVLYIIIINLCCFYVHVL